MLVLFYLYIYLSPFLAVHYSFINLCTAGAAAIIHKGVIKIHNSLQTIIQGLFSKAISQLGISTIAYFCTGERHRWNISDQTNKTDLDCMRSEGAESNISRWSWTQKLQINITWQKSWIWSITRKMEEREDAQSQNRVWWPLIYHEHEHACVMQLPSICSLKRVC